MIGTIEALGVFVLAILPGFLARLLYSYGKPPLRGRGALSELGATVSASAIGWTVLYLWRGKDLLPTVLGDGQAGTAERLDAFAELAALSALIGLALGALARGVVKVLQRYGQPILAKLQAPAGAGASRKRLRRSTRELLAALIKATSVPGYAWDRLLGRLATRKEPVICRIKTKSGDEVFGVFAQAGWFDWEADGRGVLLDTEVIVGPDGQLAPVPASQGLFVPGDEVSSLSVVSFPADPVPS